jgi:hypothetical protein
MSSLALNRVNYFVIASVFAATLAAFAAAAQDNAACGQFDWSVQREQALFSAPNLQTAASGSELLLAGGAITLTLKPGGEVAYAVPPARQPKNADSYGGVIASTVPKAGTYQVTASAEAWIDVIQNGKAATSTAHTGKRDCPGVRKSVRFSLEPGAVTIQVSGVSDASIKLALLPAE